MTIETGWHDMPELEYHADPCPEPSLSASIAKIVVNKTPLHAWMRHPKHPDAEPFEATDAMILGKAVHAQVFGGADLEIIPADNWRTKAAKEAKAKAIAEDRIPILQTKEEQVYEMAERVRERFEGLYGGPYHEERVAIWRCPRTGHYRRAMMDSSAHAAPIIVDLKVTGKAVDEEACIRRVFSDSLDVQSGAYEEAMETLNPEWIGRVQFYFQWIEDKSPYALSRPILMGEAAMTYGRERWQAAGALWDAATTRDHFPSFSTEPTEAVPPGWTITQWETRKGLDPLLQGIV